MSAKPYNPLNHSVVQATTETWLRYECDDFIEALLDHILEEIKRVHGNIYQHQWSPTWHGDDVEDPQIPGILFTRYYQDRCDCGGQFPLHTDECDVTRLHAEWNRRRLHAISDPDPHGFGRRLDFSPEREAAFEATAPPPRCTCGGDDAFDEDRGCMATCIGLRPNFQFEDVEIRWYKWPGRGMSTNKDWTPAEWRDWFNRCLAKVREFDIKHDDLERDLVRRDALRDELRSRYDVSPSGDYHRKKPADGS